MFMNTSSSSSSVDSPQVINEEMTRYFELPSKYKLLEVLGDGGFGLVYQCINVDTNEKFALKIQNDDMICEEEHAMMQFLMKNNLQEKNIIRFIEMIPLGRGKRGLVFEMLDVDLEYHFFNNGMTPLDLTDIRSIIQQLATALDALKNLEIIHSDIKPNNIMLVDAKLKPLQVRLIDFGLASPACAATQGETRQVLDYRAPEIILGLPISEAIDMWSVGIVMMKLLTGKLLLRGMNTYGTIWNMVKILGFPPDHLLEAGIYTTKYFKRGKSGQWELKTPQEYHQSMLYAEDNKGLLVRNLDQVELLPLSNLIGVDAEEVKECIDLLKAMLQFDASKRITPSQVLSHPFILRGYPQQSSVSHSDKVDEPPHIHVRSIHVKPAPLERCLESDEESDDESLQLKDRPQLPSHFEDSSSSPDVAETSLAEETPKKRKKRNIFTRFFGWVRRRVFCDNVVGVVN